MLIDQAPPRLSELTDQELIRFASHAGALDAKQLEDLARELLFRGLVDEDPVPAPSSFREHHVAFAYSFLPRLCFRHPRRFLSKLLADGLPALVEMWSHLGERLSTGEPLAPVGLELVRHEGVAFDGVLIRLPDPVVAEEASEILLTYRAAGTSYAELGCYVRESGWSGRVWEIQFDGSRTDHPAVPVLPEEWASKRFWTHVQALRGVLQKEP